MPPGRHQRKMKMALSYFQSSPPCRPGRHQRTITVSICRAAQARQKIAANYKNGFSTLTPWITWPSSRSSVQILSQWALSAAMIIRASQKDKRLIILQSMAFWMRSDVLDIVKILPLRKDPPASISDPGSSPLLHPSKKSIRRASRGMKAVPSEPVTAGSGRLEKCCASWYTHVRPQGACYQWK